jgi:hypothetical protein
MQSDALSPNRHANAAGESVSRIGAKVRCVELNAQEGSGGEA